MKQSPKKPATPKAKPDPDITAMTAREEMVLLLFRRLSYHQQRESILEMHALTEANRVSKKYLKDGADLRPIGNEEVRAVFKDIPPPSRKNGAKRSPGRPPSAPLDDVPDDPT